MNSKKLNQELQIPNAGADGKQKPELQKITPAITKPAQPTPQPLAREVKEITQTVQDAVKFTNESPSGEIPDFDGQELLQTMARFIERLNAALPEERKIDENSEKNLKEVVLEIARDAKELKTLNVNLSLSAEQRECSAAARKRIPKYLREAAKKEWDIHLRLLTELLRQFKNEGMDMMAKVDKNGIRINKKTLEKIKILLETMMTSHPKVNQLAVLTLTNTEMKHGEELRRSVKATTPRFAGINHEDIADEAVDDLMYEEILESLEAKTAPGKLAKKYILALFVNFTHLKNSHAGQILGWLEDIATHPGGANAVESLLAILDRSIKGITASQRIAQLLG